MLNSRHLIFCSLLVTACASPGGNSSDTLPDASEVEAAVPDSSTAPVADSSVSPDAADVSAPQGLHVEGNTLVDHGKVVRLLGVNHSGGEYGCVGGGGYTIFEGPTDDSLALPIQAWKANTVRIPLNEQCWLGINGIKPQYSGKNYQDAVVALVSNLRSHGMYVIVDLHWAAPGTNVPTNQQPMADADHAPDFWKSVASTFKGDLGVVFDIFNEPYLSPDKVSGTSDLWACLEHGCTVIGQNPVSGTYKSAGTQDLVDAIRGTGAQNVVMVPGLAYTSDLSGWATHKPSDATGNIAASLHLYNFNGCPDQACWDQRYKALAATVPIVTGENGEDDCGHGFVDAYMSWADALGISYLGWTWNAWDCSQGPALITGYDGTPTAFGQGLMNHLKGL